MDPQAESESSVARPQHAALAVKLIYSSFAIAGVRAVFELTRKVSGASLLVAVLLLIVFLAICSFFVSKIAAGRNWARITFLVLLLIGLPFAIPSYIYEFKVRPLPATLSILASLLQIIGAGLLFTRDSNRWFSKGK